MQEQHGPGDLLRLKSEGPMIDEQEFKKHADLVMHDVSTTLSQAAEMDDYEVDSNNGNVVIEFENPPAKFVVSPQTATRQIWVSAHSKSFKLDWDPEQNTFVIKETGQTLLSLLRQAIAKQLKNEGDVSF